MTWQEMYARLMRDRGDLSACRSLEERVRRWARQRLRGHGWHVIDDVVADTCSRVILNLEDARGEQTFVGFVHGHFRNVCRPYFRAGRRQHTSLEGIEVAAPASEAGPDHELLTVLWQELGRLPERERRAVALRHLEGLPSTAIAAELNVTESNARRLVFNGLTRLRRRFQMHGKGCRTEQRKRATVVR